MKASEPAAAQRRRGGGRGQLGSRPQRRYQCGRAGVAPRLVPGLQCCFWPSSSCWHGWWRGSASFIKGSPKSLKPSSSTPWSRKSSAWPAPPGREMSAAAGRGTASAVDEAAEVVGHNEEPSRQGKGGGGSPRSRSAAVPAGELRRRAAGAAAKTPAMQSCCSRARLCHPTSWQLRAVQGFSAPTQPHRQEAHQGRPQPLPAAHTHGSTSAGQEGWLEGGDEWRRVWRPSQPLYAPQSCYTR